MKKTLSLTQPKGIVTLVLAFFILLVVSCKPEFPIDPIGGGGGGYEEPSNPPKEDPNDPPKEDPNGNPNVNGCEYFGHLVDMSFCAEKSKLGSFVIFDHTRGYYFSVCESDVALPKVSELVENTMIYYEFEELEKPCGCTNEELAFLHQSIIPVKLTCIKYDNTDFLKQ